MPKPNRAPTTTFKVTATVIDGSGIRLDGDIVDNAISVPRGENGEVLIIDTPEYYIYASTNSTDGSGGGCWARDANGQASQTFETVDGDHYAVVYAVAKGNAASVTYGPVITIKPKG